MKKLLIVLSVMATTSAHAADWWTMDTICRVDTNKCYTYMGTGYDAGMWDANSNCWGMKMVCGNSLIGGSEYDEAQAYSKSDVTAGLNKNSDFDFATLNTVSRCYGARKTKDNGTKAMVNGTYVNVYCNGVLGGGDEKITNGEIALSAQPSCSELAQDGWVVALNNGKCYGKKYAASDYYVECGDSKDLPNKIVVLNGAKNFTTGTAGSGAPKTVAAAEVTFEKMLTTSKQKHMEKFAK